MQVGETVVYGVHSVCKITGTEQRTEGGKRQAYLVLEPVYQSGSRFLVPVDNDTVLRKIVPLLRPQDIQSLLTSAAVHKDCWIADENRRKQEYKNLLANGNRESLLAMLYTLYQNQRRREKIELEKQLFPLWITNYALAKLQGNNEIMDFETFVNQTFEPEDPCKKKHKRTAEDILADIMPIVETDRKRGG